ncbi:MAG: hypothetical protein QNK43_12260 [Amphritea sp.]|nr:hypothetical protein [Amphritea sp.]
MIARTVSDREVATELTWTYLQRVLASFVGSNIIGATSMAQLQSNIRSIDLELSAEVLEGIDRVATQYSNPCP